MTPNTRARKLTTVSGLRLTQEEETRVSEASSRAGLPKSQWLRQTVMAAVDGTPEMHALLAEFMALRAVILPLHAELMKGAKITDGFIADTLRQADARKYALAQNRLDALRNGEGAGK